MTTLEEKNIIIRLPSLNIRSFLNLRVFLVLSLLMATFAFTYWYRAIRPFLWIPSAHIEAFTVSIGADFAGKITQMSFTEGEIVREGQILFSFDSSLILDKQRQLQASIDSLNQQIQFEKVRMEKAMQDYLASTTELEVGIGTQENIDFHLALLQKAQEKSELASHELQQLNRDLSLLNEETKKNNSYSPFDAIVLKKLKQLGDLVALGEPILTLSDPRKLWVEAEVSEKDLTKISIGTPAKIRLLAYPGKEWTGKISWISPATVSKISSLPFTSKEEKIAIKVALDDPDISLKAGLSAEIGLKVH